MIANREGRFKATILDHGVAESGPNHLATLVCRYRLVSELSGAEWAPVDDDMEITGYHYMEKRDGSVNQTTIDMLKRAFGWDGRDPFWLQDADMGELVVQVSLAAETYNGKTRLKVQYVDAEDSVGGTVPKADDAARRSISTRLGAKFRALAGSAPAPAAKASPRPAPGQSVPAPAASAAPASTATADPPPEATMQAAWDAFVKEYKSRPGGSDDDMNQQWFRIVGELAPGRQIEDITPPEWAVIMVEAPGRILPF